MRSLLNFLERYSNLIIFLILEGVAIYLLTTRNYYHNTRIVNGVRRITYGIEERISNASIYFNLREINERLAEENTALRNNMNMLAGSNEQAFFSVSDPVYQQQYQYTSAKLAGNSVNKQKNFFLINKGTRQGLGNDMGVIADGSVAGIIVGCSDNFSVAMSLINLDFRLSARLRETGYFGSMSWDGLDTRKAILSDIPQHVTVNIGDTIETTGYSAIFPEGIRIGTIAAIEKPGSDFYHLTIFLETDFRKLHYIDIIANKEKMEFNEIESQIP